MNRKPEWFKRAAHEAWRLGLEVRPTYSWDELTGAWWTLNLGRRGYRFWRAAR